MVVNRWREQCPHCRKKRKMKSFKLKLCGEEIWCRACGQCKVRLEKDETNDSPNNNPK